MVIMEPATPALLKSAVVGCGRIGVASSERLAGRAHPSMLPVSHAECMMASGRYHLAAFCDPFVERARDASTFYRTGTPFADVATMLAEVKPDVVSVATRTQERPGIVTLLAEQGVRGIYADKPFSRSLTECQAAMSAVKKAGVKLALGTSRRYTRVYRRAREIAASGLLGRLAQVRVQLDPGCPLLWTMPHLVDLLVFFSGGRDVAYVQATCGIPAHTVKDNVIDCDPAVEAVTMRFDNGIIGTMHAGARLGVALVCEHGEVHVFEQRPMVRIIHGPTSSGHGMSDELIDDTMSGTVRAFTELADAVQGNGPSPVTSEDVLLNQALLAGISLSSLQDGRRIQLAEVPPDLIITGRVGELYA